VPPNVQSTLNKPISGTFFLSSPVSGARFTTMVPPARLELEIEPQAEVEAAD
jgi:hypothetical protein